MICLCSLAGINWPSDISMEPDSTETGLTPTCRRNHGGDISGTHNGVPWGGDILGKHNGSVQGMGVYQIKAMGCSGKLSLINLFYMGIILPCTDRLWNHIFQCVACYNNDYFSGVQKFMYLWSLQNGWWFKLSRFVVLTFHLQIYTLNVMK